MSARQVLDFVFTHSRKFDIGIKGIFTRFTRQIKHNVYCRQKITMDGVVSKIILNIYGDEKFLILNNIGKPLKFSSNSMQMCTLLKSRRNIHSYEYTWYFVNATNHNFKILSNSDTDGSRIMIRFNIM